MPKPYTLNSKPYAWEGEGARVFLNLARVSKTPNPYTLNLNPIL